MKVNSIRFKTTILYSCILGVILIAFSFFIFHAVKRILHENADQDLRLKAEQIVATINAYGEISGGKLPPMSLMKQFLSDTGEVVSPSKDAMDKLWEKHRWLLGAHKDIFLITDANGQVILQSDNVPTGARSFFERFASVRSTSIRFMNLRFDNASFRGVSYPFTFASRKPYVMHVAVPMAPVNRVLSRLIAVMASGITLVLFMSLFIGSFLTKKILRPVTDVTVTANNITQKNLSVRIPEQALDEEMRLLVDSFNQMIDRLDRSFAHINEFSSHVAHELKTPLAIIKGELELAVSGDNSPEESRRVMLVALQEVDRLIKITKDLLLLAKFEYNQNVFKMERVDFTGFMNDLFQHARVLAAEKGVPIDLIIPEKALLINADLTHLRRLFFNLIHNAVKFTPSDGQIKVTVEVADQRVITKVIDNGEGISPKEQLKIFDKFYSVHKPGQSDVPGNGLGLCLARSIARAHGGDITVESEVKKGATFTVDLPLMTG
jgi:signal transduction histidine kinase